MKKPKYCLEIWGREYDRIKDTCICAEELGYYGFFYGESLTDLDLDCWTVLSSLIPLTKNIRLGPVITYINPTYRSLALLAKQAITFQDISNGRLEFRTGAGAASEYSISWWDPYGINYPDWRTRIAILEEGLALLQKYVGRSVSNEREKDSRQPSNNKVDIDRSGHPVETIDHNGKYYRAKGAKMTKPLQYIPITIAAKSTKTMQIAAKYADIWESSYLTPIEFSSMNTKFGKILKVENNNAKLKTNRSSSSFPKRSIELDVIIAESSKDLQVKIKTLAAERGPIAYRQVLQKGLVGTPNEIRAKVSKYIALGIDQFFLAFQDPLDLKSIELFMKTVKLV